MRVACGQSASRTRESGIAGKSVPQHEGPGDTNRSRPAPRPCYRTWPRRRRTPVQDQRLGLPEQADRPAAAVGKHQVFGIPVFHVHRYAPAVLDQGLRRPDGNFRVGDREVRGKRAERSAGAAPAGPSGLGASRYSGCCRARRAPQVGAAFDKVRDPGVRAWWRCSRARRAGRAGRASARGPCARTAPAWRRTSR